MEIRNACTSWGRFILCLCKSEHKQRKRRDIYQAAVKEKFLREDIRAKTARVQLLCFLTCIIFFSA